MPTPRTVSQIKSNLLRPALTSAFEVQLPIPSRLRRTLGTEQEKLNLLCSEAVLPGSQLATSEIRNDLPGVTERHAHRRIYDDRIDLTFYVDAREYLPIRFFEAWMSFIVGEDKGTPDSEYFIYRLQYPNVYTASGLKVIKFEKDYQETLEYEFVKCFPLAINSMPVSYEGSSLLKCTVSMTYIRYVVDVGRFETTASNILNTIGNLPVVGPILSDLIGSPVQQALFNAGGLSNTVASAAGNLLRDATGSQVMGNLATRFASGKINQVLGGLF